MQNGSIRSDGGRSCLTTISKYRYVLLILLLIQVVIFILSSSSSDDTWGSVSIFSFLNRGWTKNRIFGNGPETVKRVLFWTTFYTKDDGLPGYCLDQRGLEIQEKICRYSCHFTTNKSLINSSHAVVFHGRDLAQKNVPQSIDEIELLPNGTPRTRKYDQYWTFLMFESPFYTWTTLDAWDTTFNWTMSFRHDSDIYIPYGNLVKINSDHGLSYNDNYYDGDEYPFLPSSAPKTGGNLLTELKNKTKLVAWIVSNCQFQQSERIQLVTELEKHVTVDIYGKCGTLNCNQSNSDVCQNPVNCYRTIGKLYKFYLALENSLCEEYVTEKFFNALHNDLVPIVLGHVNYTMYAPKSSFIDVRDFGSVAELADYLIYLNQNDSAYLEYFEWKKEYYVHDLFYMDRAWCTLCAKLWMTSTSTPQSSHKKEVVNLSSDRDTSFDFTNSSNTSKSLSSWWFAKNTPNYNMCIDPRQCAKVFGSIPKR